MNKPDFNKAAKVVEDYYNNVYIDNDYTTNTNAFKGKKGKRKVQPQNTGKTLTTQVARKDTTTPPTKEKGSTNQDNTTAKAKAKVKDHTTTYNTATNDSTKLDQTQLYETGSPQQTNATLTIDHMFTDYRQVQQWVILSDTGAMTNVAPSDYFPHIPLKQLRAENPQTLTAVNGGQVTIHGIKQRTMAYNNLVIPTTFIIADANCAILGLDAIKRNAV
eukprot:5720869-Amphidinium_carterae.1